MKIKTKGTPHLIRLPARVELLLYLIREELKATKMRLCLQDIGAADNPHLPDVATLLLATAGFKEVTDEQMAFYCRLVDRHAAKLNGSHKRLMKQTMKVYVALMHERKREKDKI